MKFALFILAILAFAIFIFIGEGGALTGVTLWNMMPLAVSLYFFVVGRASQSRISAYSVIGFLCGSMLLSGWIHLKFLLDINEIKSGSSTSVLMFLFLPVYALVSGAVGGWVGYKIGRFLIHRSQSH